jgi:hypothetical protein
VLRDEGGGGEQESEEGDGSGHDFCFGW